eukprot:jgi/Tetstr1/440774/TSEL_029082.t1
MAGRGGGVVQRPTLPVDACPPACTELYRRLCERLAVPSRTPPKESPEGCETRCETGAALLKIQAQWLERAVAHEIERGRAGSWLHDRHRLVALRQLRAMALCLARGSLREKEARMAPPNANDRREISRRS